MHITSIIISPLDNMFKGNYAHYFQVGYSAVKIIQKIIKNKKILSILDYGSGYGRVTRFIKSSFYQAEVTCSDIDLKALKFVKDNLDVEVYNPNELFKSKVKYDLIFAGSVITHLDMQKTHQLLNDFSKILNLGGYLIFSSHGEKVYERIKMKKNLYGLTEYGTSKLINDYENNDYGYSNYPNQNYGISIIHETKMKQLINKNNLNFVYYEKSLWDNHHDIYAAVK